MADEEVLRAVCCLAGAESDVTVEELQLLSGLARRVGIERKPFESLIEKAKDKDFRQQQIDFVTSDVDGSMNTLIRIARQEGSLQEGHVVMLLWRVAMKLQMSPERFEELLAVAETSG